MYANIMTSDNISFKCHYKMFWNNNQTPSLVLFNVSYQLIMMSRNAFFLFQDVNAVNVPMQDIF